MILVCTCAHAYQDKLYGKNRRVHNQSMTKMQARCTVCSNVKSIDATKELIKIQKQANKTKSK